ncbi:hypothetical protein MalM25_15130 [Planctomycetes bacterium MalM25]|nr:hypothetical protein MalM25_15130 [Planctomycetes bacterium MalM25]
MMLPRNRATRRGNSLLELMTAVTILGVLAAMALPRTESTRTKGNRAACHVIRTEIELQSALWMRATGSFPTNSLSDIGIDPSYFPQGVPSCPVDGATYTIDADGRVVGHNH